MALAPGDRLHGRYRVERALGEGGMGRVHLVVDEARGREVVLKELHAESQELLASFRAEFALLVRAVSPFLTRVHDYGTELVRGAPVHFYTAAWVHGATLAAVAKGGHPERLLPAVLDALEGLETLHALSMRHGDFTPENVMVRPDGHGVLIDLGCARAFDEQSSTLAGTPGFLSEELLETGAGDARSDLYAVGVTLERVYRISSTSPPAAVQKTIERLKSSLGRRPTSVHDVLDALGRHRSEGRRRILGATLVGRESSLAAFESFCDRARSGDRSPRVLLVHGAPGAGTSRLVREMLGRAELSMRVVRADAADPDPLRLLTGVAASPANRAGVGQAIVAARAAAEQKEPILFVCEDAHRLSSDDRDRLFAFARSIPDDSRSMLLVSGVTRIAGVRADYTDVTPLDEPALRQWTRGALSEAALHELWERTAGFPARVELALARGDAEPKAGASSRQDALAALVRSLNTEAQLRLAGIVAAGGELDATSELEEEDAALLAQGLVTRDGPVLRLTLREDRALLVAVLPRAALVAAHRALARAHEAALAEGDVRGAVARLRHLTLAGDVSAADAELAHAVDTLRAEPRLLTAELAPLLDASTVGATLLALGEAALAAQEPDRALGAATRALRLRAGAHGPEARLLAADAFVRKGLARRAERVVAPLLRQGHPRLEAAALLRVARARTQRGDHAGAEEAATTALTLEGSRDVRVALREARALAQSYLGKLAESVAALGALYAELDDATPVRDRCRILGQRAIAEFRLGHAAAARQDHSDALALAEAAGQDDLVAVCALNVGTAEQEMGSLGAALASYDRGLVVARALGRASTELTLRYNTANLRTEIGDLDAAESELALLTERAAGAFPQFGPAAAVLLAEIALLRDAPDLARAELERARSLLSGRGPSRELVEIHLLEAGVLLAGADVNGALRFVVTAQEDAASLGAEDLSLRAELTAADVALARNDAKILPRLVEAAGRAASLGHKLLEAKLATKLLEVTERFEPAAVFVRTDVAQKLVDRLAEDLPDALRKKFYEHPARRALTRMTRIAPRAASPGDTETLRRLLSLSRRLNSSLSVDRVLDYAVDAAVELTRAERGFLLLVTDDGTPRVAASRDGERLPSPPSSSIVRRVLDTEEPVLTTDAESDPRFAAGGSIHAMRLKSVLAVPILTPSGAIGILYVDSRVTRGRFAEADREVLSSLADHAALAVGNARLHDELARRATLLAEQKVTIERLSRGKDREIVRLKEQVLERQRALELRYDYSRIVGRGPAMQKVLEQLDRIIDSQVNVLIEGESGTGKELVARAIHFNGARRDAAFVGVNCAALPETLLESELFGHVRGAFTGADRDKKGLVVEAHGGTLFLDELGEMPVSVQAKLLRVIQEREVRPVGAARAVSVDVRLVCATHRDLEREVAEGRFREDLYYRVAVVSVPLPPLRDRLEDLPDLCRAILERLARARGIEPPQLDTATVRALSAEDWPGNVRQLENTLTRAFVLAPGPRLTVADLGLGARRARPSRSRTRREFQGEERERILTLLHKTRWNVSLVARTLGIPRNSFYRKLTRYGLTRSVEAAPEGDHSKASAVPPLANRHHVTKFPR